VVSRHERGKSQSTTRRVTAQKNAACGRSAVRAVVSDPRQGFNRVDDSSGKWVLGCETIVNGQHREPSARCQTSGQRTVPVRRGKVKVRPSVKEKNAVGCGGGGSSGVCGDVCGSM